MRVAVVGTGYVGLVTGNCLSEMVLRNHDAGVLNFTTDIRDALEESEVAFIAVGTPPGEDGSADLKYVLAVAKSIGARGSSVG